MRAVYAPDGVLAGWTSKRVGALARQLVGKNEAWIAYPRNVGVGRFNDLDAERASVHDTYAMARSMVLRKG
jgi:hypothetical protein